MKDTADECRGDKKSLKKKLVQRLKMLRDAYESELEQIQQRAAHGAPRRGSRHQQADDSSDSEEQKQE